MPTPRPEMSLRDLGGGEAGVEEQLGGRLGVDRRRPRRRRSARARRPCGRPCAGSMPRPSSRTEMTTLPPAWRAEISSVPVAGLPAATRSAGRLEAVVERVADEVHERVAERVDDGAVELGVLADELELDLLVELGREVAHEAREAQEDGLDGDHPDLHDHLLQGLRGAGEVLHRLGEARARRPGRRGASTCVRCTTSSPMKCMSWSSRSASTRTVEAPLAGCWPAARAAARRRRPARRPRLAAAGSSASARLGVGLDGGDVRHGAGERGQRVVLARSVASHTSISRPSKASTCSSVGAEATISPCSASARQHHVGADGGHRDVVGERGRRRARRGGPPRPRRAARRRRRGRRRGRPPGSGVRSRTSPRRLGDQRLGVDPLLARRPRSRRRPRQRVEAREQHVDGVALEAAGALAQQLEDVLHLVRERRHAGEAHRRAHALQGVRDAEDLVDRLAVVGLLLDPDDGEVELLEVLARLRQEHREVLGDVHASAPCGR